MKTFDDSPHWMYLIYRLISIPILQQEGPWALDRSIESLSGGEDVYHKI